MTAEPYCMHILRWELIAWTKGGLQNMMVYLNKIFILFDFINVRKKENTNSLD